MDRFSKYLDEIKEREKIGLSPKPIDMETFKRNYY